MVGSYAHQRLSAPICLTWQITGRCNLHCRHCLAGDGRDMGAELSMGEIKDFFDDLAFMKVFYINIGGGEPLLHPLFFDIMDEAAQRDIYVQFSTNGTLVDTTVAAEIARRGLRVQVSLDGWQPGVNDPIRGDGTFEQAVRALDLLRQRNVTVSVNCVVTKDNITGLEEMYRLAVNYGAGLRLSRLRPSGRASHNWRNMVPCAGQYRMLHQWLLAHPEVRTGDSFFFLAALGEPLPGLNYCGAGRLTCAVDPQGCVYPCPFTIDPALRVGNIREKPLSRLWLEEDWQGIIPAGAPAACASCHAVRHCRGGCRGAAYIAFGCWDHTDPECLRREVSDDDDLSTTSK